FYSYTVSVTISIFFITIPLPPRSTLFPYTTLFRSQISCQQVQIVFGSNVAGVFKGVLVQIGCQLVQIVFVEQYGASIGSCIWKADRKSTRLNSSHVAISYAVFCLKKKKKNKILKIR